MKLRFWQVYRYASPLVLFVLAWVSFNTVGWLTWLPLVWTFGLIPLAELFLPPDTLNLSAAEEALAKADERYDWLLYAVVPLQYLSLLYFLLSLHTAPDAFSWAGRTVGMGLLCGIFGINVAHELGHRTKPHEQFMAKALLLTSAYLHFFIEHNKGHHKRVATPDDPASARRGENIYAFYCRSIVFSYVSAWAIANAAMRQKKQSTWGWHNEMVQFTLVQLAFAVLVFGFWGWKGLGAYAAAAGMGILLLEAVNYIEHYGLSRKPLPDGKWERALPQHSWNSNHWVGRLMLFELSRHSDHHYLASRKYQVLRHFEEAPQLPTGYPGMLILAHFPPLYKSVMHRLMGSADEG